MIEITRKNVDNLLSEIEKTLVKTDDTLKQYGYNPEYISPQEFYNYMTGEIFSEDTTTLTDVLSLLNLMIHEVVEISELKKLGKTIDQRVIVDSPRETIYDVHFTAMDIELDYLRQVDDKDTYSKRLNAHYKVLTSDSNLPELMRPRAVEIWEKHSQPIT